MARILYDHLLSEAGLDLLTEAGDALVIREIGMAGDATATGGSPGTAVGSGRIIGVAPPVTPNAGGSYAAPRTHRQPATLRGNATISGQPGSVTARGRLTLVGRLEIPPNPPLTKGGANVVSGGILALRGHAALTAPPARLSGRGDVIDELALILALAA